MYNPINALCNIDRVLKNLRRMRITKTEARNCIIKELNAARTSRKRRSFITLEEIRVYDTLESTAIIALYETI